MNQLEEYSGKVYSVLVTTLPFLSKNHLSSPKLLESLGYFNLQVAPAQMSKTKFYKYISNHDNHKEEKHFDVIDCLASEVEISFVRKEVKDGNPSKIKQNSMEMAIDGESYKKLKFEKIVAKRTKLYFNLII